jgi:uncharacterized cupin superfamily protein
MGKKHRNITHISEVEPRAVTKGSKFGFAAKRLGPPSGAAALGCSYIEVEPGRQAFPLHYHCANEEGIYIIEGTGEARIGKDTISVGPGDYIAYPVGPDHAHSLKNTGKTTLKYLALSTMHATEVVGYPDSKKFGVVGLADPVAGIMGAKIKMIIKDQPSVDYYEGEE